MTVGDKSRVSVTCNMDVAFFGAIGLLVDLDDEMRGREVPLGVPISSCEIFREI